MASMVETDIGHPSITDRFNYKEGSIAAAHAAAAGDDSTEEEEQQEEEVEISVRA